MWNSVYKLFVLWIKCLGYFLIDLYLNQIHPYVSTFEFIILKKPFISVSYHTIKSILRSLSCWLDIWLNIYTFYVQNKLSFSILKNNKIDGALSRSINQTTNTYLNMWLLLKRCVGFENFVITCQIYLLEDFFHEQGLSLNFLYSSVHFCRILDNYLSDLVHI